VGLPRSVRPVAQGKDVLQSRIWIERVPKPGEHRLNLMDRKGVVSIRFCT
jgi:hypothetical protein